MRILYFILFALIIGACNQNRLSNPIQNNGTIRILSEEKGNPYTYLQTQGRIAVQTIPAISFYATLQKQDRWITLLNANKKLERILGGIDTIGFSLQEFYDENNPNVVRMTFVQIDANGLQPAVGSVLQRSFPFIFGANVSTGKSDVTISTQPSDMERVGNHWTIHIVKTDKENPIAIPIITTPHTVFTLKDATENKTNTGQVKFVIDKVTNSMPKVATRDTTTIGNMNPLIIQGASSWDASKPVSLEVFIGAEKVGTLTISLKN